MPNNESSSTSKSGTDKERQGKSQPVVGRDVPDESKEHHTEIAVEAGRKIGDKHDQH